MTSQDNVAIICVIFVLVILYLLYKKHYKRITSIDNLPTEYTGETLSGKVTFVSDGGGFKFFHVPLLRSSEYISADENLTIRLAGIDAPKLAQPAQGRPEQPFALKAKQELEKLVFMKNVDIKLLGIDRYNRLLAMCFVKGWFSPVNVNIEMVNRGMASVYRGSDAVYGYCVDEFFEAENKAKEEKVGIWSQDNFSSPVEFRRMHRDRTWRQCLLS